MKSAAGACQACAKRRAPRGARGLKFEKIRAPLSPPGRAPRGARGLKSLERHRIHVAERRAPRGARGLKLRAPCRHGAVRVAPRAGRVD